MDVRIFEGWPLPDQLDLDLGGKQLLTGATTPTARPDGPMANVSIFPFLGTSRSGPYQILNKTYVIVPPAINLTVTLSGTAITITGTPAPGEFVTVVADRQFIYSQTGSTAAAILASLQTAAEANYGGVTLVGSTLTIPADYAIVVRQGGRATMGRVIQRECQSVTVTVWAPDHATRTALSKPIDVAIKTNIVVTMPDTTEAKIIYLRTNVIDDNQNVTVYRRDLVYDVEYATLEEFPGFTITSVQTLETVVNQGPPTSTTIVGTTPETTGTDIASIDIIT